MTELVGPTPSSLFFMPAAPSGSSRQSAKDGVCGSHRGCGHVSTRPPASRIHACRPFEVTEKSLQKARGPYMHEKDGYPKFRDCQVVARIHHSPAAADVGHLDGPEFRQWHSLLLRDVALALAAASFAAIHMPVALRRARTHRRACHGLRFTRRVRTEARS